MSDCEKCHNTGLIVSPDGNAGKDCDCEHVGKWKSGVLFWERYPYSIGLPVERSGDRVLVREDNEDVLLLFCEKCGCTTWQDNLVDGTCPGPVLVDPSLPKCDNTSFSKLTVDPEDGLFLEGSKWP